MKFLIKYFVLFVSFNSFGGDSIVWLNDSTGFELFERENLDHFVSGSDYLLGLRKTTDGGKTWSLCLIPETTPYFLYVSKEDSELKIEQNRKEIIVKIISKKGYYVMSTDEGWSWKDVFEIKENRKLKKKNEGNVDKYMNSRRHRRSMRKAHRYAPD